MTLCLTQKYLAVHRQGFMPIFVQDQFDARLLVDCAVAAGAEAIEITCRRSAVLEEVRWARKAHPQLTIVAGSVVDDGPLLSNLQRRRPDMPSIDALLAAGVDGVVSALPLRLKTIERVSRTHLVIPGVETMTEAVAVVEAGAHFAKLFTADLLGGSARVARMTCAATHGVLPLFVTGGITLARIEEYVKAGAAMLGSGWDVILGSDYVSLQKTPDQAVIAGALVSFLSGMLTARHSLPDTWPDVNSADYAHRLRHFVPSSALEGRL